MSKGGQDLDALSTLPESEMRCGLGEVAKYHFLTGDDLLSLSLEQRVAQCVRIKSSFVEKDEREGGQRALLNYGHTLAHALEIVGGHQLAHGRSRQRGIHRTPFAIQLRQTCPWIIVNERPMTLFAQRTRTHSASDEF